MQIQDIEDGMIILKHILQYRPIILMCACRERKSCHRVVVAQRIYDELGVVSTPLKASGCRKLIEKEPLFIPNIL